MFSLDATKFNIIYPGENAEETREFTKRVKLHEILNINSDITTQFTFIVFYNDNYTDYKSLIIHILKLDISLTDITNPNYFIDLLSCKCKYISTLVLNQNIEIYDKYYVESFDLNYNFNDEVEVELEQPMNNSEPEQQESNESDDEYEQEESDESDESDIQQSLELIIGSLHPSSNDSITYEDQEEINFDIKFFYENFYVNCDDLHNLTDFIDESVTLISPTFHNALENVGSGIWFNLNDIRWQYALRSIIINHTAMFSSPEILSGLNHKYFIKTELKNIYFETFDDQCSYFSKCLENIYKIPCVICKCKLDKFVYHNPYCGNLCATCYITRITEEQNRIKYLKKMMLLPGKRAIFNKELEKTKKHIEKIRIKTLSIENKLKINRAVNKELSRFVFNRYDSNYLECSICLDNMNKNSISVGSCGHCFHTSCIKSTGNKMCPICRCYTTFTKLYI